jgi:transketolase
LADRKIISIYPKGVRLMPIATSTLQEKAGKVRRHIFDMAVGEGCFVGAALSCVEILLVLYECFLRVDPTNLRNPARDYLVMSKGHAVPALYGALIETGLLEKRLLKRNVGPDEGRLYWHPDRRLPGVEFFSGSLGHGLPLAVGLALDCKLRGYKSRVVVLTGDGELNEGSNWEALLVARAYKLDNLLIIVDRNGYQANSKTEDLIPLEPLAKKFSAFGCVVNAIDGHSFKEIKETLAEFPFSKGQPGVIIANTLRGKGIEEFENNPDYWFVQLTAEKAEKYKLELAKI